MGVPATKLKRTREIHHEVGNVLSALEDGFVVESDTEVLEARRATSCLLEPIPGDLVLVAVVEGQSFGYVLAVLERGSDAPATLVSEGDLNIRLKKGVLGVVAPEAVRVASGAFEVHAAEGQVAIGHLSFLTRILRGDLGKAKLIAETVDSVVERVLQKVKRSYRFVEECDHVRADQIDYMAKKTARLHGETTLLSAEQLAKVEADQIHLG